jgi:hypothetical protein
LQYTAVSHIQYEMPRYLLMSVKQHENRQSTQPATDNPPKPQAVMWCGFDENLE